MTSSCNRHKHTSTVFDGILVESPETRINWFYTKQMQGTDLCPSNTAIILL